MLRILHLTDSGADAAPVRDALENQGIAATFSVVKSPKELASAIDRSRYDLILVDSTGAGLGGVGAIELARAKAPGVAVICVSPSASEKQALASLAAGAAAYVVRDRPWELAAAIQNARACAALEQQVKDRTAQLEQAKDDLETLSSALSHDLRAPLRAVRGFSELLVNGRGPKTEQGVKDLLRRIHEASLHLGDLVSNLVRLSRLSKAALRPERLNLSQVADEILSQLMSQAPERPAEKRVAERIEITADRSLMRLAMEHLLSNAWKYSSKQPQALIEFGSKAQADGSVALYVRDNGVGFDCQHADKLFKPFHRLHTEAEFPGTGVGLAIVHRIIQRHGGRVWAESVVGQGATFFFTVSEPRAHPA